MAVAKIPPSTALAGEGEAVPPGGGPGLVAGEIVDVGLDVIGGVFGDQHPKDDGRKAAIDAAFAKAIAGDVNAALFVRQRTGHFPGVTVPGYGYVSSGGSDGAQRHARIRWATLQKEYPSVAAAANAMAVGQAGPEGQGDPGPDVVAAVQGTVLGIPVWLLLLLGAGIGLALFLRRR